MKKLLCAMLAPLVLCLAACGAPDRNAGGGEDTESLIMPLLEVLQADGGALYTEMKRDATSMLSGPDYKTLTREYTLAGLDGFLDVTFESPDADIHVKADNARIRGAIGFYVRGVSPDVFLQAKAELEALGARDWVGHTDIFEGVTTLEDTGEAQSVLKDYEVYFLGTTLEYEGTGYQVILTLLTQRQTPYYIDSFEDILGDEWPEVNITISRHD